MKKLFLVPILISLLFIFSSCEDDSSTRSVDGYLQEEMVVIHGHDNIILQPGDLPKVYYTEDDKYWVIPTGDTVIMHQRSSCSGFDVTGDYDEVGGTCEIKFTKEQVDWTSKPYNVRPSEIRVYNPECLVSNIDTNDCNPCK